MRSAPNAIVPDSLLPALRELLSRHPSAASASPEWLARRLHALRYVASRPDEFEVQSALEALVLEGEVVA